MALVFMSLTLIVIILMLFQLSVKVDKLYKKMSRLSDQVVDIHIGLTNSSLDDDKE